MEFLQLFDTFGTRREYYDLDCFDDRWELKLELPGVSEIALLSRFHKVDFSNYCSRARDYSEGISLSWKDDRTGEQQRTSIICYPSLMKAVDWDRVTSEYSKGVLSIILPKFPSVQKPAPKQIPVTIR